MTDIVERLRVRRYSRSGETEMITLEAAAEIERLRAALREAVEFIDQAEMALTPHGETYVAKWRAALEGE